MIRDLVAAVSQTAGMLVAELERIIPIIVFLLAAAVLAELSDRAGVFDVVGHWLARQARHRLLVLWLLFSAYAVICTVFLSLDTTAVLLTPVALAIAKQVGVPARPFALTTLWIANTGSMLLPVSNLTNLLAQSRFRTLGVDHTAYLRLALVPGLVSIVVTLVVSRTTRSCCASGWSPAYSWDRPSPPGWRPGPSPAWPRGCCCSSPGCAPRTCSAAWPCRG